MSIVYPTVTMDVIKDCVLHGYKLRRGQRVTLRYTGLMPIWRWRSEYATQDGRLQLGCKVFDVADVERDYELEFVDRACPRSIPEEE